MSGERLPGWVADATDPSAAEGEHLLLGDADASRLVAAALQPLDEEVEALVRRAAPVRSARPWWPAGLALAAALAIWLAWPVGDAPVVVPAPPALVALPAPPPTESWRVSDPVEVVVDAGGTTLVQREGVRRYEVDPVAVGRHFRVVAGDVVVEVVGTAFDVGVSGSDVWVEVLHGRVRVRYHGREELLDPGRRWSTPSRPAPSRVDAPVPVVGAGVRLAALLDRVEAGEQTPALVVALREFAAAEPGSPLAGEAVIAALEIGSAVETPGDALGELDAWLGSNPGHPRRSTVLELRATVARDRVGDCLLALPSWDELAVATSGARRGLALADAASCAVQHNTPDVVMRLRAALAAELPEPLRPALERALTSLVDPEAP